MSDFALMLELNKRTEQVKNLKEARLFHDQANVKFRCQVVFLSPYRMQQGGLSHRLATWFLSHCPNLQLLRDVCRCVCNCILYVAVLSKIMGLLLPAAGLGTRRTGLELRVLQETKDWPLAGLRKLERFQQQTNKYILARDMIERQVELR